MKNPSSLSLFDRLFLRSILQGLMTTARVFLGNMGQWLTFRKGALTSYYPEETRSDFSPHNRGKHILVMRDDQTPQCVACNLCATVCPARAIDIVAEWSEATPTHPRRCREFSIDYSRCIFCGFCVEACPLDAIRMTSDVRNMVRVSRHDLWRDRDSLLKGNH